jgi:hypothetical protein
MQLDEHMQVALVYDVGGGGGVRRLLLAGCTENHVWGVGRGGRTLVMGCCESEDRRRRKIATPSHCLAPTDAFMVGM